MAKCRCLRDLCICYMVMSIYFCHAYCCKCGSLHLLWGWSAWCHYRVDNTFTVSMSLELLLAQPGRNLISGFAESRQLSGLHPFIPNLSVLPGCTCFRMHLEPKHRTVIHSIWRYHEPMDVLDVYLTASFGSFCFVGTLAFLEHSGGSDISFKYRVPVSLRGYLRNYIFSVSLVLSLYVLQSPHTYETCKWVEK